MTYVGPYLIERSITKFRTKVELEVTIDTRGTIHSDQRQGERNISDSDIRAAVFAATEDIMQDVIDGKLKEGEKFHIKKGKDLNLICTFKMNTGGSPERVTVITAIRKKDFIVRDVKRTYKV